jgi:hypothetical protein
MPSVALKITHTPSPAEPDERDIPRGAGPLFRGSGDIDYLCGNCGFVIASGMGPSQHFMLAHAACAACGATNEFPPELLS